jgi:hypothetical protein
MIFFISFFIVNITSADEQIDNLIDAVFNVELFSATNFIITISMDINQINVFDETYDSVGVQNLASSNTLDDIEKIGAIKLLLSQFLENQIEESFHDAEINPVIKKPNYESGLFISKYTVNLSSSFFDMEKNIDAKNFINGVLDMGAIVNYTFDFVAESGWNNTIIFDLGKTYDYHYTTGFLDKNKIEWKHKNWNGDIPTKKEILKLKKKKSTLHGVDSDDIFLNFEIDLREPKKTSLSTNLILNIIDIKDYHMLPDVVNNLSYVSADGLRLFIDNGLTTWNDSYDITVKPLEYKIKTTIEQSIFNQTLDLALEWDEKTTTNITEPFDIFMMDSNPPIKVILFDNKVDFKIHGISSRAVFGLINSGADITVTSNEINFGDNINAIGKSYNVTLYLPRNLYLNGSNVYTFDEENPISGDFESDYAISYSDQNKETIIELDVETTDLNLVSFFTGNTEIIFGIDFKGDRNYHVTTLPNEFSLPEKIIIENLNSDVLRVCIEEGVFSDAEVDEFLNSEKDIFESLLRRILPGLDVNGKIIRDNFEDSLSWNGNISTMDGETPVIVASSAHSSYPVKFDLGFLPPKFEFPKKSFNFTGIQNHDVTYKIIFPNGIDIDVSDPLGKAEVKRLKDDRYCVEIFFMENEANLTVEVSYKMTPSILFIIGVMLPCIITLIITLILIIVINKIRKKRKGRGKKIKQSKKIEEEEELDDEEVTGYEDKDYYVPPPPKSK